MIRAWGGMLVEKGTGTLCFGGETESPRMEERAVTSILWVSGCLGRTRVFSVWGADRGHQWSWVGGSQRNKGRAVGTCETQILGEWGRGLRSWARCVGGAIRTCEIRAVTVKGTPSTHRLLEPGLYKNDTHTSGVVCEYRCGGHSTPRQPSERRWVHIRAWGYKHTL